MCKNTNQPRATVGGSGGVHECVLVVVVVVWLWLLLCCLPSGWFPSNLTSFSDFFASSVYSTVRFPRIQRFLGSIISTRLAATFRVRFELIVSEKITTIVRIS